MSAVDVIANITAWREGHGEDRAKLNVAALDDALAAMYEPRSPTSYCALLLGDLTAARAERDSLRAEVERLTSVLDRIANQGLGYWSPEMKRIMGSTGLPWVHWATIAEEALEARRAAES